MIGNSVFGAVAATHAEAGAFRRGLGFLPGGELESAAPCSVERLSDPMDDFAILLAVCGPGPERAELAARALVAAGADGLMSIGVAGGLVPELGCGHVLIADEIVDAGREKNDGGPIACVQREGMADTFAQVGLTTHFGRMASSETPLLTPEAKELVHRRTGALAVDMESLAVARVADEHMVLFMAVRSIADTVEDEIPRELLSGLDADGHLAPLAVLGALARQPRLARDMYHLAGRSRTALKSLAAYAPELAYHAEQLLAG